MLSVIDGILDSPNLESSVGKVQGNLPDLLSTQGTLDFRARAAQLEGKAFLQAFQSLKGGGQITEAEGRKATAAIARLDQAQSEGAYREALLELRGIVEQSLERARNKARKASSPRLVPGGANGLPREVTTGTTQSGLTWKVK